MDNYSSSSVTLLTLKMCKGSNRANKSMLHFVHSGNFKCFCPFPEKVVSPSDSSVQKIPKCEECDLKIQVLVQSVMLESWFSSHRTSS